MVHHVITELDDIQMEGVCGGTPNAGKNLQAMSEKISIKMNISIVIIVHTVINAPVTINIGQGL